MMIPIRCMTCGRPIAQHWDTFRERLESGEVAKKILDDLGIKEYCCRSTLLTHVDYVKDVSEFKK